MNLLLRVIGLIAFGLLILGYGAIGPVATLGAGLFCWLLAETVG